MALEAGLDTGPVYRRVTTAIDAHESAAVLRDRLVAIGSEMLVDALAHGPLDPRTAVAQRGEPTYAAKLDPSEFAIDWTRPASALGRLTRLGTAWTVFRGKRVKILEALAAGTPVVSTRVGAEGLELAPDRDLIVADTPAELVDATLAAIRRPEELADTAESGRERVLAHYSWELLAERLDRVWNAVARVPALAAV